MTTVVRGAGTRARRPDPQPEWLRRAVQVARPAFRRSAAWVVAGTAATVLQWSGLASVVAALLPGGGVPGLAAGLAMLLTGAVGAVVAVAAADRAADRGVQQAASALRSDVVERVLPDRHRPASSAARVADTALDLPMLVARAAGRLTPLHGSLPASMGLVLVVVTACWWPLAVVLLAATLLLPVNLRVLGAAAQREADEAAAGRAELSALVLDTMRGGLELRMLGALGRRRRRIEAVSARTDGTTMRLLRRAFIAGAVTDVLVTFAIAVAATATGLALLRYLPPGASFGLDLPRGLLALTLCPVYFAPVRQLAAAYHDRAVAQSAVVELSLLPSGSETADPGGRRVGGHPAPVRGVRIDVSGLRVPLDPGRALRADLRLRGSEWTAVVGPSGSGKTTLLAAIAGLTPLPDGVLAWTAGRAAVAPDPALISWIGQETVLLDGTLADNVRLGEPTADEDAVERALVECGLGTLLERLPQGIDTPVGTSGRALSHGESRRVAIARAVLKDAPVWVLDEPDAHLDDETAADVLGALRRSSRDRTVVIATHSHRVTALADAVWEIDADSTLRPRR